MRENGNWQRLVRRGPAWFARFPCGPLQRIGKEFSFLSEHHGDGYVTRPQPGVAYYPATSMALISVLIPGEYHT